MKREEKNQQTKRRILDSALSEFSEQGYGASSINTICSAQNISKGIVYHYFDTKDGLFLACVEECFHKLTNYIQSNLSLENKTSEAQLKEYFAVRSAFFKTAPVYQRIFCDAVIAPPEHLRKQVQDRRESFDRLNLQILEQILRPLPLRPGVSRTEVIETFRMFQDFINVRCQMTGADGQNFEVREENCQKALDILLYGVVERGCPGPA